MARKSAEQERREQEAAEKLAEARRQIGELQAELRRICSETPSIVARGPITAVDRACAHVLDGTGGHLTVAVRMTHGDERSVRLEAEPKKIDDFYAESQVEVLKRVVVRARSAPTMFEGFLAGFKQGESEAAEKVRKLERKIEELEHPRMPFHPMMLMPGVRGF